MLQQPEEDANGSGGDPAAAAAVWACGRKLGRVKRSADPRFSDVPIFSDPAQRVAWVNAAPLLLGRPGEAPHTDVQELAELVALTTPLIDFGSSAPRRQFLHRSCTEVIGNIALTNAAHTGLFARFAASPEALIHLPLAGLGFDYRVEGRAWRVKRGCSGLYLPGLPAQVEAGPGSGLLYNLDPALLARHVCFRASIADAALEGVQRRLQEPIAIDLANPRVAAAWGGLRRLLQRLQPEARQSTVSNRLHDAIYYASARMLFPDLF